MKFCNYVFCFCFRAETWESGALCGIGIGSHKGIIIQRLKNLAFPNRNLGTMVSILLEACLESLLNKLGYFKIAWRVRFVAGKLDLSIVQGNKMEA